MIKSWNDKVSQFRQNILTILDGVLKKKKSSYRDMWTWDLIDRSYDYKDCVEIIRS